MNNSDDINKTKEQLIKELELLRQQNEEKILYKEIYNAIKDGVVVADDKGKVLLQNTIAEDIFNSLNEEPFQQDLSSLFVPEETLEVDLNVLSGFHKRKKKILEDNSFTFSCKLDGGKNLEIHKVFFRSKVDNKSYAINIIKEITEHKLYEILFNNTLDLAYICDAEGKILYVNKVFEKLTGHKIDEFLGRSFAPLFDEENLKKAMELYNGTLEGETLQREIAFKKTGILCEYKNMPLKDDEGTVIGILGIARDISCRRQMEEYIKLYARQKAIIAQIGTTALSDINIEDLFVEVVSVVRQAFNVDCCNIVEYFPDKRELVIVAGNSWGNERVEGIKVETENNSQEGHTLLCKGPVVSQDINTEKRFHSSPLVKRHGIISALTVIIHDKDTPFGILGVYTNKKRVFLPNDIHFLQSIANILAEAIERKRIEKELILLNKSLDQRVQERMADLSVANILLQREVEKHKHTANALQVSESKYEDLYNNAPVMYITVEMKTFKIVDCNNEVTEKMGYGKKEIIGKDIFFLCHPESVAYQKQAIQSLIEKKKVENVELRLRNKDESIMDVILNASVVFDEEGILTSGRFVWKNITDLKRVQTKLRKSRESLAHAQRIAHLGSWEWDILNDIVMCSDEVYRIFGLKPQAFVFTGEVFMSFLHTEYKKSVRDAIVESIREKKPNKLEYVIVVSHGNERIIIHEWEVVCDNKDNVIKLVGILQDITVKRKMAQELLKSKKLQAMGIMTSGIAHEFNNILAIISGNVQMLMRENKGRGKLLEELRLINKSCKDGAEIIRRMNEFTRTTGDIAKYVVVNINELVKNAVDFTRPRWKDMAEGKGTQYLVTMEGLDDTVLNIKGNPSELREVMVNIIYNALEAMPEGGQLSFSTWEEMRFVCLRISDTGIGMDEETQSKIFDPFYTSKGIVGMGLGLSLVYGIVVRHGGKIVVKSTVGKGSDFVLKFPSTKEAMGIDAITKEKKKQRNGGDRILIVEDQFEIGKILKNFLSDHGYVVQFVDNGREAISLLQKEPVDMIICDIGMPGISGWDIMDFIDTLEIKPKIAISTGFLNLEEAFPGKEVKAAFVIRKPFELDKILSHIQNTLENQKL